MTGLLLSAEPSSPWFSESVVAITLVLVSLNVLLIVCVHGRRIRQYVRRARERRFQARLEAVLAKLDGRQACATGSGCRGSLRTSMSWNGRWLRWL